MARGRNHTRIRSNFSHQQQHHHYDTDNKQGDLQTHVEAENFVYNRYDELTNSPLSSKETEPVNGVTISLFALQTKHIGSISDPANNSTKNYQITTSNNSNRNIENIASVKFSNSAEKIIEPAQGMKEENAPSTVSAEALERCENTHLGKDQHRQSFLLEHQSLSTQIIDRNAFPSDLHQNDSTNTTERLETTTKDADAESKNETRDCGIATNANAKKTDVKNKFNELAECDRWVHTSEDVDTVVMGQTNGKQEATRITRASTTRKFRESVISGMCNDNHKSNKGSKLKIPTITVIDYSTDSPHDIQSGAQSIFCGLQRENPTFSVFQKTDPDGEMGENGTADVLFEPNVDTLKFQFNDSFSKLNSVVLEEVPDKENFEEREKNQKAHSPLSVSFPDSGIGLDSLSSRFDSPSKVLDQENKVLLKQNTDSRSMSTLNSEYFSNRASSLPMASSTSSQRTPFTRDGYSTDCDDTLMQCNDFDFISDDNSSQLQADYLTNERLVCIESISLPDVVVESTANVSNAVYSATLQSPPSSLDFEHILSFNGATGDSIENVHFVPIRIENCKDEKYARKRLSADDSGIRDRIGTSYHNGFYGKQTLEITPEEDSGVCVGFGKNTGKQNETDTIGKLRSELTTLESRYNAQMEDIEKKNTSLQIKVNEMQALVDTLEKDLAIKTWNVEKLQAELNAAHKDGEFVRKRLKLLEEEKTRLRHKYCDNEEELKRKYEELEEKYKQLEEKNKETQQLASTLQIQVAEAQSEAQESQEQLIAMRKEMEEDVRLLRNALENSKIERKICEDKWQKEFEILRTQNQDREESLMIDCEWQLRQMQKQCKDKFDKAEISRKEAIDRAELLECAAQERLKEVHRVRQLEAEAKSLRGLTSEQEHVISTLSYQLESLKSDLQVANENLEVQIEAVKKIKHQCDNKIYDKEREFIQRIDYVRNEAAAFWENKLYTEMTRLTSELESVFIDERREALNKLQAEHIEELRALTTRYTENEEELRMEIGELQERLRQKSSEYLELREKSDSALLQTRMHLDRADRDYQNAMSREEEKREALEESLRREFETEKNEMEEKFRERIGQVKEEFSKELQMSSQAMKAHYKKELAQQKAKLQAERDEAVKELSERHRQKLAAAEDKIKDTELWHQRDLKDLKAAYNAEKASLDKRDISNANEIEQLHRKCRCLTNLFEEMRVRYERRDPRPEDLREISELRSRCESQERDLYLLTDRLRELQMQIVELQQHEETNSNNSKKMTGKSVKKPPPKTIPTNCDVIYEENEDRDSSPPTQGTIMEGEHYCANGDEHETTQSKAVLKHGHNSNNRNDNYSCRELMNEDDGHMITSV